MQRVALNLVSVNLPLPPSVNKAFASRHGSHMTMKTAAYRFWLQQVKEEHGGGERLPKFRAGFYGLWIDLPAKMRGDTDNRTKLISDVLKSPDKGGYGLAVVTDDAMMRPHHIEPQAWVETGRCVATVVALESWPGYVCMRLEQ